MKATLHSYRCLEKRDSKVNFKAANKYLDSLKEKLVKFDLKTMQKLVKAMELEPARLKVIHITGSNGKGSTSAFVSSILKEAGYKTGSYTSPHLSSVTERIKINGKKIPEKTFAKLVFETKKTAEKMKPKPSYFETVTAAAIKYFLDKKTDFVVAEVGMGGRLDATNVLHGTVNVITDISLEHTQTLGNTIQKIAKEKSGIIKHDSFTVTSRKNAGYKTIEKIVRKKKSKLISPEFSTNLSTNEFQTFDLKKPFGLKNAKIKLLGEYQIENAAIALSTIYCLQKLGYRIPKKAVFAGLENAFWPARLQAVKKNPLILIDSTHTPHGAVVLKNALKVFDYENLTVVFSCLKDKDFKSILGKLDFHKLVITKVNYKRAMEPKKIQKQFPFAEIENNMKNAIRAAKKIAGKNDLILITGSIYGAGEAMRALKVQA